MQDLIYNHKVWINETDPQKLRIELSTFLNICGYTVLGFLEHHFQPSGYTALWLLAESHLATHTFPEKAATYVELSGCNFEKNEHFYQLLTAWREKI